MDRRPNAQGLVSSQQGSSSQPYSPYFMSHRPEVRESQDEGACAQTQLMQSFEKVRTWQSTMQTKCDDLNRKLKESEENRERQQQNILELQMNFEQLGARYDAELKNREALSVKIANTRTVSEILQNHCQILTETMQRCITERDRLTELFDTQYQQICHLECRHAALKEQYKEKLESLTCLLSEEQARREHEQQKSIEDQARLTNCYDNLKEGLEAQLAQERTRLADMEKKLTEANNQIEELKKAEILASQEFSKQWRIAKEKSDQLSHSKEEMEKVLRGVQQENSHLKDVVVEKGLIEDDLLQAKNRISQLEADKIKHIKTEEELNACIETTRNEMEQLRIEAENLVTQSKSHESDMKQKMESMRAQNEGEVSDLRKTLDEVRNQAANIEVGLRHQVETYQAELEALKIQGQDTEQALQDELHTALNSISELKHEISNITEEYQGAKSHLDEQIKDLELKIQAHHESEQQTLRELTEAQNEVKNLLELQKAAQEVAAEKEEVLQAKFLDEKNRVESLQTEIQILMEEQINAKATIAAKEMEELKFSQELQALREVLEEVTRKAEEQDKECSRLKEDLEASKKYVQTNDNINHDLKLKCQTLESNLLSAKSEVHELSNTMNAKDSKISELENLLDQINKTCNNLKDENNELRLYDESIKKKIEEDIQMVNEQYSVEISVKNEKILELETACQRQEQQLNEMQKNLEELSTEFQNKLSMEKDKRQQELHLRTEEYTNILAEKDKMLEATRKQMVHSDQEITNLKTELADFHKKLTNAEIQIDQVTVEKETKLKIFLRDLDGFKRTSEDRLMEITKLKNQLTELQNNYHQAQEQHDRILNELHQVEGQLKQTQIQLKHAKSEAHAAKTRADHMHATFAAYKAEKRKRHMEAALRKSALPGSSTFEATPSIPQTSCPQTPTNTERPGTPRSILKITQPSTPQSAKSPKKVKFTVEYGDSGSSCNSINFEPEETEAIARNPKLARVLLDAKRKEKEDEKRRKRAREEEEVQGILTQKDVMFKKPSDKQESDTSDAFDWLP